MTMMAYLTPTKEKPGVYHFTSDLDVRDDFGLGSKAMPTDFAKASTAL